MRREKEGWTKFQYWCVVNQRRPRAQFGWELLDNGQRAHRDKGSTPVLRRGDRLPNFQNSRSDFTRTDGKEAVNGFPAKKFRRGRACRFPTNSILRLLAREGRTDFQHSGTSLLCAFERKTGRISNIRATLNRRSNRQLWGQ